MEKYFTRNHIHRIDNSLTFEELADIAIEVLKEMYERENKPIVEICGPISTGGLGNTKDNLERFDKAIKIACDKGMCVFTQLPFERTIARIMHKYPVTDGYHLDILEIFYRKIFSSGYIHKTLFLPDWQSSKGARWERDLVTELGLEVLEFPIEWFD